VCATEERLEELLNLGSGLEVRLEEVCDGLREAHAAEQGTARHAAHVNAALANVQMLAKSAATYIREEVIQLCDCVATLGPDLPSLRECAQKWDTATKSLDNTSTHTKETAVEGIAVTSTAASRESDKLGSFKVLDADGWMPDSFDDGEKENYVRNKRLNRDRNLADATHSGAQKRPRLG